MNTFTNIVRGRVETAWIRVIWYQTVTESQTRWLMSDVWRPHETLSSPQLMLTVTWPGHPGVTDSGLTHIYPASDQPPGVHMVTA